MLKQQHPWRKLVSYGWPWKILCKKNPLPWIAGTSLGAAGLYTKMNPGKDNLDSLMRNYKGEVGEWDQMLADIRSGKTYHSFFNRQYNLPLS